MPQNSTAPLPDGIRQHTVRANGLDFPVLERRCLHRYDKSS
jgi:hypothetical protein